MFVTMRGILMRSNRALKPCVTQKATVVSGPPRVRIPLWEKLTTGIAMNIIICAPIVYIMANLQHYRNFGKRAEE